MTADRCDGGGKPVTMRTLWTRLLRPELSCNRETVAKLYKREGIGKHHLLFNPGAKGGNLSALCLRLAHTLCALHCRRRAVCNVFWVSSPGR